MAASEQGSVLLLTVGLVVVLVGVLVVVAGVSQVILARQALVAATDAAALRAAQAVDLDALYDSGSSEPLPGAALRLDRAAARTAVADYVERAGLAERFDDFELVEVRVDEDMVTVRTRTRVRPVLVGPASGGRAAVGVEASSTARLRVR